MNEFTFDLPTSWRHGSGMASRTGEIIKEFGCRKTLLLTDRFLLEQKIIGPVLKSLDSAGIEYVVCGEIDEEPTVRFFDYLADTLDLKSFDSILAVGGGSVLDVAKGLAVVASFGGNIRDYNGFDKVPAVPDQKIIAVPTTSGTGSEVSDGVVLIDEEKNTKFLVISKKICPAAAITDPELTRSVPYRVAVCSGIDALVHATESFLSRDASIITETFALKAVELLTKNFKQAVADSQNIHARESMQVGATMAMIAGMNSHLGLCHALAMPLCAHYHMPHGQACGMVLPAVLQYNAEAENEKVVRLLKTMGLYDEEIGEDATQDRAYEKLNAFLAEISIVSKLGSFGYRDEDLSGIAEATLESAQTPTNPRKPSKQDIADIILKVT